MAGVAWLILSLALDIYVPANGCIMLTITDDVEFGNNGNPAWLNGNPRCM